jgi:hypothetical protein
MAARATPDPTGPAPSGRGRAALVAAAALLLAAPAARAGDDDAALDARLGFRDGMLCVEVHLRGGFDAEVRDALAGGLPITLTVTTELWRERHRWFDEQLVARVRTYRIRWDPGERRYTVTTSGRRRWEEAFDTLGEAIDRLSTRIVPVVSRDELENRHAYFALVEVAIRHLTLEEVTELDGWIRGKLSDDGPPPEGGDGGGAGPEGESPPEGRAGGGGLSGAFLDLLVGWAGFGDRVLEDRTPTRSPADLPEIAPGP